MTALYVSVCIVALCVTIYLAGALSGAKYYLKAANEYDQIIDKLNEVIEGYKKIVDKQNAEINRLRAVSAMIIEKMDGSSNGIIGYRDGPI